MTNFDLCFLLRVLTIEPSLATYLDEWVLGQLVESELFDQLTGVTVKGAQLLKNNT